MCCESHTFFYLPSPPMLTSGTNLYTHTVVGIFVNKANHWMRTRLRGWIISAKVWV